MDCLTAQRLVSEAMDRLPVDSEDLAAAKVHCGECETCASFVRAMLALQRTALPSPPDGLAVRIVEQIRAEANSTAIARARALAAPAATVGAQPRAENSVSTVLQPEVIPATSLAATLGRLWEPRNRRSSVTWFGMAATIFVLAGWGAIAGVRAILPPTGAVVEYEYVGAEDNAAMSSVPESAQRGYAGSDAAGIQPPTSQGTGFITHDGAVYQLTGSAADVESSSLTEAGTTRTNLGGSRSKIRDVLRSPDGALYMESDDGSMLKFAPVEFSYGGRVYKLVSPPIEAFGEWPTLPDGMTVPRRDDGFPTFRSSPETEGIFVLRGSDTSDGFAMTPATPLVAQLSQCPNWTWWQPRQ